VSANGLTTKELYVINTGNGELAALEAGKGTVGGSNAFLNNIWTSCNIVKANAQLLIDNYQNVRETGTTEMIRVYGHVYKALAIGTMAQFWESVPTEVVRADNFLAGQRPSFKIAYRCLAGSRGFVECCSAYCRSHAAIGLFQHQSGYRHRY
jgi:hypothetical protein